MEALFGGKMILIPKTVKPSITSTPALEFALKPGTPIHANSYPDGIYLKTSDDKNVLFIQPYIVSGNSIWVDTGIRRLPLKGEYFYIADANGAKYHTVYSATGEGTETFPLGPTGYGILKEYVLAG